MLHNKQGTFFYFLIHYHSIHCLMNVTIFRKLAARVCAKENEISGKKYFEKLPRYKKISKYVNKKKVNE